MVNKFGLDVGVTGATIIKWVVWGPTGVSYAPGALSGDYGGVSAEATAGVGLGANALIGGSDRSFILQPLSVQAQEGLNLAVGFTPSSSARRRAEGERDLSRGHVSQRIAADRPAASPLQAMTFLRKPPI